MNSQHRPRRILGRLRIGRRDSEARRERQLKKAQQLAAMRSERGRAEANMY
jgi:hypothetical protein